MVEGLQKSRPDAATGERALLPDAPWSNGDRSVIDRSSLSLVQRLLLTTDGTVTHILEAYAGEPVEVVKIDEWFSPADRHDGVLVPDGEETVLRRKVLLRGKRTRSPLIYAESDVVFDRLAPALGDALVMSDVPVGKLLFEHRVEVLREIVASGQEPAGRCGFYFGVDASTPVLFRTYRMVNGGRPLMVITERFPASAFRCLGGSAAACPELPGSAPSPAPAAGVG